MVMEAIGLSLDRANVVIETFDESECDFVVGVAIGFDSVPVGFDKHGKFFKRWKPLVAERLAPAIKEATSPTRMHIVPKLTE